MFGIVTKNNQQIIEQAVGDSSVFAWDGTAIREQLDSAARVHIRTLIIEIDSAPIDQLIMGLRSFRRQRPNTRIVVLAYNRQPGDPSLARCVALGIYDIVVIRTEDIQEEDLSNTIISSLQSRLQGPLSTYADAAKWDLLSHEELPSERAKKGGSSTKEVIKEKVVIQERLIGTPVIAVSGAHAGAGTTYCSLQICQSLLPYGTVAYVELESTNGLSREKEENPAVIHGLEVWRVSSLVALPPRYNYIVVNVGYWPHRTEEVKSEVRRASKAFLATGSSSWRYRDFSDQVESLLEVREDWNVLLQAPSDRQVKEIRKDMADLKWPIFPVPYQPEPFELTNESKELFEEALQEYTPKKTGRTSLLSRLFARA